MGEQDRTRNVVHGGTFHGPVIQAGRVWVLFSSGRGPVVALAAVMALIAAVTTYLVLDRDRGRDGGSVAGPTLTARYDAGGAVEGNMVLDRSFGPTGIPASVSDCLATWSWMRGQGGTDVGTARLVVEATGGNGHAVTIQGLRATLVGTPQDPPTGTAAHCPAQGVGSRLDLGIDLDSVDPVALAGNERGISYAPFFTNNYVYVEPQKPEVFSLAVLAARKSYAFVLTVEGSVDGKHRTWTLRDGDHPFRVAGIPAGPTTNLRGSGDGWATEYGHRPGPLSRCNPCRDEHGNEVAGTSKPGAPMEEAPPPEPPSARPATPMPPVTVMPKDPQSVALAWVLAADSVDVKRGDSGPGSALPRMKPYMTGRMAAAGTAGLGALPWPSELVARQGWSVVTHASVSPLPGNALSGSGRLGSGERTEDTVELMVQSTVTYHGDDGWSRPAGSGRFGFVTLRRQPDGTYLVDGYRS